MGVFKRYRDAQAEQKDAENAMPGAYQSNYTDRINEALDSMGAASNAGYDVGTDSELYRQYRAGAQANARAAAENAAAGAAALSGGYGSSYAGSVARQGYQQAMANVDDGLAGLRDKALTMYQLKQNGLSGLLSALQNQDSLEAAEHQGAVANAQDWRDYKKSRADQAAQEKQNFWDNLMQVGTDVVKAGFTAYDRYKGYDQWQKEFETGLYNQAFNLYKEGATGAANSLLSRYGLDSTIFDDYTGGPMTWKEEMELTQQMLGLKDQGADLLAYRFADKYGLDRNALENYTSGGLTAKDKLGYFVNAANLAGGGNQTAADNLLTQFLNMPAGSAGSYSDISKNLLATTLAKKSAGSSGGSSGSRSSGTKSSGDKSDGIEWSANNLLTAAEKYGSYNNDNPAKDIYKRILQEGGLLETPTNGMKSITDDVLNRVAGYAQRGMNGSAITVKLQHEGYSNEEIAEIFNRAGL